MDTRFETSSLNTVVLKLGSTSIIRPDGVVRLGFLGKLVTTIGRLHMKGLRFVIVSSGAIAMGAKRLQLENYPVRIADKQACASAGQTELMALYENLFSTLSLKTGQVLLTRDDLEDRRRYLNARETLLRLLEMGVVPIVNENDSVSVDEIKFGDNDELSAMVAGLVDADLLLLLTDVDGVYDSDPGENPDAKVIPTIESSKDEPDTWKNGNTFGSGGMDTKLEAAQSCRNIGTPCIICRSKGSILEAALKGEFVGTLVVPQDKKLGAKNRWLAKAAPISGILVLDSGAIEALCNNGKSLLPPGVKSVEGDFIRGAVVCMKDSDGNEIGRGIVRYASEDLQKIIGKHGDETEEILGFTFGDEIIHRDDLILTK